MTTRQAIAALDPIVAGSKSVLEAMPADRLDWRPHEKSWTMKDLAAHVAQIPSWTAPTLTLSEFDISPKDGAPPPRPDYQSVPEICQALEDNAAQARSVLENASDADLQSPWTMLVGGEVRFTLPKGVVFRTFVLDHMIHHRAQLGVYLRLAGAPVPQTFGPTADFPAM